MNQPRARVDAGRNAASRAAGEPRREQVEKFDLIVLGAGPAGIEAALTARSLGMRVLIIDEAPQAGGQYYRAPNLAVQDMPSTPEKREGDRLRMRLAEADVQTWFNHRIWSIEPSYRVACATGVHNRLAEAPAMIIATGVVEKVRPVPGWTQPGVMGLAAAAIMVKSYKVVPGKRVLLAGSGPLLYDVANKICAAGGEIAAVVDAVPIATWMRQTTRLARKPKLLAKGLGWMAYLRARGVKIYRGHALCEVLGSGEAEGALIRKVDADWYPVEGQEPIQIDCDTVCYGYGLQPGLDMSRLLGAEHVYKRSRGGWTLKTDRFLRTSLRKVYAAGDVAGAFGIDLAGMRGRLAAYTAAMDGRFIEPKRFRLEAKPLKDALPHSASFGRAVNRLSMPRRGLVAFITPETTICRCESITRSKLEMAIQQGAHSLTTLRSATRCGMGPCGGRYCLSAASTILREELEIDFGDIGIVKGRSPMRPVHIRTFTQDFSYSDLPPRRPPPL